MYTLCYYNKIPKTGYFIKERGLLAQVLDAVQKDKGLLPAKLFIWDDERGGREGIIEEGR